MGMASGERSCDARGMEQLFAALSAALAEAPREALRATLPLWRVVQLRTGQMLWKQGRPADMLAVLHSGELDMVVNGTVVAQLAAPEMIGESALYDEGATHFDSMCAREATQVLVLPLAGVATLRAQHGEVHDAVVQRAIAGAARRGQTLDRRLAQVRKGNFAAPLPAEPVGLLTRLWRKVARSAPDPAECPSLAGLLERDPVLARASAEVRAGILEGFTRHAFRAGDVLTRQDDADPRVFVLAAGQADVLREIDEHGGALLLGQLEPGKIFGVNAFIQNSLRTASIVATTDGWVYAMTRERFDRLPAPARMAWFAVTLAVYVKQYQEAAKGLQVAIRVFASRHDEMMPSRVMTLTSLTRAGDPERGGSRKRR